MIIRYDFTEHSSEMRRDMSATELLRACKEYLQSILVHALLTPSWNISYSGMACKLFVGNHRTEKLGSHVLDSVCTDVNCSIPGR